MRRLGLLCALSVFILSGCHSLYRRSSEPAAQTNSPTRRDKLLADLQQAEEHLIEEGVEEADHEPRFYKPPKMQTGSRPYFDWPVDEARLTRGFSSDPVKSPRSRRKRPHLGVDLAAPKGSPILASHSGVVIYVGNGFKGYGKLIVVEDQNGWASLYAHLSRAFVREGQRVLQGEKIGAMGKTGRAFGVHLHFEIRTLNGPIDPLEYLPTSALRMHQAQK